MLVKAIIVKIIDSYSAKIRIPLYDQVASSTFGTEDSNLSTATICCPPGCVAAYMPGDVVYVDFEMDKVSKPVILGILSRPESKSSLDIKAQSVSVAVSCDLPERTSIENSESQITQFMHELNNRVKALEEG